MPLLQLASPEEPQYVQQIRRHKAEIATQIVKQLGFGHVLEELGVYMTDFTDPLGALFFMRHPLSVGPVFAVVKIPDLVPIADAIVPGMGIHFRAPAPPRHIRVLSCANGQTSTVLLRCFPDSLAAA